MGTSKQRAGAAKPEHGVLLSGPDPENTGDTGTGPLALLSSGSGPRFKTQDAAGLIQAAVL